MRNARERIYPIALGIALSLCALCSFPLTAHAQEPQPTTSPANPPNPKSKAKPEDKPKPADKEGSHKSIDLEERLRRLEEANTRLQKERDESNARFHKEYDALLKKLDRLTEQLEDQKPAQSKAEKSAQTKGSAANADAKASLADRKKVEDRLVREVLGEIDTGLEPSEEQQDAVSPRQSRGGAEGVVRRGAGAETALPALPLQPSPGTSASTMSRMDRIGEGAQGTGGRTDPEQQPGRGSRGRDIRTLPTESGADEAPLRHEARVEFGEGLEFKTEDDEFRLQFHDLTQVEYRGFPTQNQGFLHSQFFIPRQRWYFTGDLTKKLGFYTSINRGYGTLDLLDAFLSVRVTNNLRFRAGRMKTPYLYEYYSIAEGDLIAPERSLFAGNLALNRRMGAMVLYDFWDSRIGTVLGVFNGPRRSFQDYSSNKDLVGYFNARPFLKSERFKALNYLNIGGSFDVGYENNSVPEPILFETANDQTPNSAQTLSPTFLALNKNVIEFGERQQWAAHLVWFYKSFFFISEYGGVRQGYGVANGNHSTPVNATGYMVQSSYFLTGEQLTRRVNVVKPRRDFVFFKNGDMSPGAIEVHARWSTLDIGRNIFTSGFADPNQWTNHAGIIDIGANWYLNFYTRVFLDWQHGLFGNPVIMAPGKYSSTSDIFWLRFQIFF